MTNQIARLEVSYFVINSPGSLITPPGYVVNVIHTLKFLISVFGTLFLVVPSLAKKRYG